MELPWQWVFLKIKGYMTKIINNMIYISEGLLIFLYQLDYNMDLVYRLLVLY